MVPDKDYDPILKAGDAWYQTRITTLSKDRINPWRCVVPDKDYDLVQRYRTNPWRYMVPDKDYDLVRRYRTNPWRYMVPGKDYYILSKDIDPKIFKIEPVILNTVAFYSSFKSTPLH